MVLLSSGSSGNPKAAVHDLTPLLARFEEPRPPLTAVSFLAFDHIGGVNTLLSILSRTGCLVVPEERSPDGVLAAVAEHAVQLLPVSPTFMNLVLLSEAWRRHDCRSLETVTYGTEPMPEATLRRFHEAFPGVKLQQMYGLSEVGILGSRSRAADSTGMSIGGSGFDVRIVEGKLEIKAETQMLGYLNAPSPFTADGWMRTDDAVEVDGEWIRVLGRASELINVAGKKVWPAEIENVVHECEAVIEATAWGEPNPITGQAVCVRVRPRAACDERKFARDIRRHCRQRLEAYKVPVRVIVDERAQHGPRFKKLRVPVAGGVG